MIKEEEARITVSLGFPPGEVVETAVEVSAKEGLEVSQPALLFQSLLAVAVTLKQLARECECQGCVGSVKMCEDLLASAEKLTGLDVVSIEGGSVH